MSTHSHTHHHGIRPASTDGRLRSAWLEEMTHSLRLRIWALALVIVIVIVAVAVAVAGIDLRGGADRVGGEPAWMHPGIAVTLAGGVEGRQVSGIVYASEPYWPPGMWRGPPGPGLR
jgi:hypothetical protein